MLELWQHAISPINLPFTILLGAVGLYWTLGVLGFLDLDDGHGHADAHVDLHGQVSGDADSLEIGDVHHSGLSGSLMHFLHMGEVPFMVVASILSHFLWVGSMLTNYHFNEGGLLTKAVILLIPVSLVGIVATHFAALPFRKIYQMLEKDYDLHAPIVGSVATVVSGEVSDKFGQVVVESKGAPITLNARIQKGEPLRKGDKALVVEENKENRTFNVVKYEQTEIED